MQSSALSDIGRCSASVNHDQFALPLRSERHITRSTSPSGGNNSVTVRRRALAGAAQAAAPASAANGASSLGPASVSSCEKAATFIYDAR